MEDPKTILLCSLAAVGIIVVILVIGACKAAGNSDRKEDQIWNNKRDYES